MVLGNFLVYRFEKPENHGISAEESLKDPQDVAPAAVTARLLTWHNLWPPFDRGLDQPVPGPPPFFTPSIRISSIHGSAYQRI